MKTVNLAAAFGAALFLGLAGAAQAAEFGAGDCEVFEHADFQGKVCTQVVPTERITTMYGETPGWCPMATLFDKKGEFIESRGAACVADRAFAESDAQKMKISMMNKAF